jgi:ribosome recycling factor
MSETEQEMLEKEVEKIVKEYNNKIDEEVKIKSDDVMKV